MRIAPRDGRIAGTKVFHYLVMPDSAGSFLLPEVRYPYYDLAAGEYRTATAAPRALAGAPGIEPHAARALPPLARGRVPAWAGELARGFVPWGWLVLFVGPPLLVWLGRRRAAGAPRRGGALRAAADSFAARAAAAPRVPAHWYNLGATLYRAGADGKATAAWVRAVRLAPRDPLVRRARELLPAPDAASEALLTAGLATPGEWALAAGLCWVAVWTAVGARRRRAVALGFSVLGVAAAGLAAREGGRRGRARAVVLNAATPVRVAPYGGASPASMVEAGAALLVDRRYGAWLEVHRADGVGGWVLAAEVSRP